MSRRTVRVPRLRMPSSSPFTLIEALVVVVILGVLAAVIVFAVNGITDPNNDPTEWEPGVPPTTTTTTTTTAPVALLTCEQLDNAGYDGLASCIDANGNVTGPGQ